VCPLVEFSRTLRRRAGRPIATAVYLSNTLLCSAAASACGLVNEVSSGVCDTQRRALQLAGLVAASGGMHFSTRGADGATLIREAVGHAECRLLCGGEARSSDSDSDDAPGVARVWRARRVAHGSAREQSLICSRARVVATCARTGLASCVLFAPTERAAEAQRVRRCVEAVGSVAHPHFSAPREPPVSAITTAVGMTCG
jgi:hypothetical protein